MGTAGNMFAGLPREARSAEWGFSLVESITIIAIISILTTISVASLPAIRAHQALVADTEQIRSLLLDSKQRSLNQVRPEACVAIATDPRKCSDVGITFTGGKVVQYADVVGDLRYNPENDIDIVAHDLQSVVVNSQSTNHFVFYGNPPSVDLYAGDVSPKLVRTLPGGVATILLEYGTGKDRSQRTLEISSFGTIDVK